jgi:hypothetical protein
MSDQPAEIIAAHGGEHVAIVQSKGVELALVLDQRLMQMPAARHHIRQCGPAHEAGEAAVAPRHLLRRGAEQDHGVRRIHPGHGAEGEFDLTGAQLGFDRAQRQAENLDRLADRIERGVDLVEARFGEELTALRQQRDVRGRRRPSRIFGA